MSFTIRSWNNTNPVDFPAYEAAEAAALTRASAERGLVKLACLATGEARDVRPDGSLGAWYDDSPMTEKEIRQDAYDALEDER